MALLKRTAALLLFLYAAHLNAQSISGVINIYAEVTAISGPEITLSSALGFAPGDRVLIIQMQGAEIDESDAPSFGDIAAYNNAGNYEFGTIVSVSGSIVTVEHPFCLDYTIPDAGVQLIRVPVYDNATITGMVTGLAWDGTVGGVVALEITNTLTFNENIFVTGQGFRGGTHCTSFFSCAVDDYYTSYTGIASSVGGEKGEGIALLPASIAGGRGKSANGGGGSNAGQHGGGGGSNGGAGGLSGYQWTGCPAYDDIQAFGGTGLDYSGNKIFMGGGGGGGHQDNGLEVADGSNGGGIVIITANTIEGNGYAINANGADVTYVTDSEGAGGGGAGGTVILRTSNFTSDLFVNIHGGKGGSIESTLWAGTCHGPGGGGGGGMLGLSSAVMPVNVFADHAGGDPGIITSPGAFCDGTSHGAEAGSFGDTILNIPASFTYPVVDLGNDTTVCVYLDPFVLNAGGGYDGYIWNDGSTDSTYEIFNSGNYFVTVTNAFGCEATDTVFITVNDAPPLNLPDTLQFCAGESFTLDAGPDAITYLWQNGNTSQTFTATDEGIYWVTITNAIGCSTTDTCHVLTPWALPEINLGNDTIICLGDEKILDATGTGFSYLWNDGTTAATLTATIPGIYSVVVSDTNNCSFTDEINLSPGCGHDIFIPTAFSPNGDGVNDIYNIVPFNELLSFDIQIFSRWGQLIFESTDINTGWDGTYNNITSEIGTYIFKIVYQVETFDGAAEYTLSGTVALLR